MAETRPEWSHIDPSGKIKMVDVSHKDETAREARAEATVIVSPETMARICGGNIPKGNVFETARVAGVMAAKKTWDLIPLCHPLRLTGIDVDFELDEANHRIMVTAAVRTRDRTGVEMEAMTAAAHASLTIYDMCKAIDKGITITDLRLIYKSGGKSGEYKRIRE